MNANEQLLDDYRRLKSIKRQLNRSKRKIDSLEHQLKKLRDNVHVLKRRVERADSVTHVIDGVALTMERNSCVYGPGFRMTGLNKFVEGYTGASGDVGMGIKGRDFSARGGGRETWFGLHWRYKDAHRVALRWLLTGVEPTQVEQDWGMVLWKRDPKGRWSAAREAAEEAAWRLRTQ